MIDQIPPALRLRDVAALGGYFCKSCQKFTEIDPDLERWRCQNKTKGGRTCGSYAVKFVPPVPGCEPHTDSGLTEVHV